MNTFFNLEARKPGKNVELQNSETFLGSWFPDLN